MVCHRQKKMASSMHVDQLTFESSSFDISTLCKIYKEYGLLFPLVRLSLNLSIGISDTLWCLIEGEVGINGGVGKLP